MLIYVLITSSAANTDAPKHTYWLQSNSVELHLTVFLMSLWNTWLESDEEDN